MSACVVDTNVILVANLAHADVSEECVVECVQRLTQLMKSGVLIVDDAYRILSEYQNKTTPRKAKGVGDVFVKWALSNLRQAHRVHRVALTENGPGQYAEFPDAALESAFDATDRKYVAVSHAHAGRPPIWQATDCKWLDWWPALKACGVTVEFLCGADVCRFYTRKFPGHVVPALP